MRITAAIESWPIARPFTTARGTKQTAHVVVATITDGNVEGRGECVPYPRYGDDPAAVAAKINAFQGPFDRLDLLDALPAGPARNAIDCALWDLEAKRSGRPAWQLAGVPKPVDIPTAFTLPLNSASAMGQQAEAQQWRPLLKIKLGSDDVAADVERLRVVRTNAPGARLIVDANEGWNMAALAEFAPVAAALGVELIEQPLPEADDQVLAGFQSPVSLAADESIRDGSNLAALAARYQTVNIKLDKTGGLTRALTLVDEARKLDLGIMVGCMVATSLSMAPALLLAGRAQFVDLDGPDLLAADRAPGLPYVSGCVSYSAAVWG
ncbi:MAG: dipeptide epimerase [Gammaproteobacteria bacterium]|nr:dipeptide epimerase [Gammaproteobacteria bacterium]